MSLFIFLTIDFLLDTTIQVYSYLKTTFICVRVLYPSPMSSSADEINNNFIYLQRTICFNVPQKKHPWQDFKDHTARPQIESIWQKTKTTCAHRVQLRLAIIHRMNEEVTSKDSVVSVSLLSQSLVSCCRLWITEGRDSPMSCLSLFCLTRPCQ